MTASPFVVPITSLRRTPGARRDEHRRGPLGAVDGTSALEVTASGVPAGSDVVVDVVLEVVYGGIVVTGAVGTAWEGECRRCLQTARGNVRAEVREIYRPHPPGEPADEETYPLGADHLDLRPLARDAILLALPVAPLCRPDCAGLCPSCGADLNVDRCDCPPARSDLRWAALDALRGP